MRYHFAGLVACSLAVVVGLPRSAPAQTAPEYLINTLAGVPAPPTAAPGSSVTIVAPPSVAVDSAGNVYIGSSGQYSVFKLDTSGVLTRIAGTGVGGFTLDSGSAAPLSGPNTWRIVGCADFNGDGQPHVVWQDPVSGASRPSRTTTRTATRT
ncbi:MAG: hypothetical protein ABSH50_31665 [Bryobacteraceae bacterium]|jgi:hypothetical protein